ncbi:uncharacterized protein Dvir_GJ10474 [Drosophila virilis]|uniref:Uncharacterized protein n=1 Tax=Drosophila virilis TaxID=7244 RepID=B4M610_DROVI|nr:uncharacterized protein Dvir_GJ10474 [Drosophila virilis]
MAGQACNSLLSDPATQRLLRHAAAGHTQYQLAIVDGAFPECALGIVHRLNVTAFIYINTVAFYTGSVSLAGNPDAYAVTPHVFASWTLPMHYLQRVANCLTHVIADLLHWVCMQRVHRLLRQHLAWMCHIPMCWLWRCPSFYKMDTPMCAIPAPVCPMWPGWPASTAVPLSISASWMPSWLEFMAAAPASVIYLSMGFSVRSERLPAALCQLFVAVFTRLPHHHVLWTWAGNATEQLPNLPANVRVRDWLSQQDILGHRRLQLFITHGGLLSQHEAVFHDVLLLMLMPVFCDYAANAAQAQHDCYARQLELAQLDEEALYCAIYDVLHNDCYRHAVSFVSYRSLDVLALLLVLLLLVLLALDVLQTALKSLSGGEARGQQKFPTASELELELELSLQLELKL